MEAFQLGVAAGNESASSFLEHGFDDSEPTNGLYYLGQQKDLERVRRYKAIWKVLSSASYASPKVPEINDIVPLPPAPLPAASGKQLEMDDAIAQLEQALTLARTLAKAAQIAKATPGDTGSQKALNASLAKLKAAGILMSAPQGIGIVSPKAVRVASGSESVGMMSCSNTDISSGKSFTAAAGESVSLLAQKAGMKLIAGKGKVEIQAQDDELSALAKNDITVTSAEGKITVTASEELILTCGGGYIKLSGGNIEIADPQNILFKSANWQKMGPASLNTPPVTLPEGYGAVYVLQDEEGKAIPLTEYRITTAEGTIYTGVSDKNGKTAPVYTAAPDRMNIEILGTK
ncbi:uncharacterized protein (DUF2345 family) [Rahnella sp. BIGb0603]|uniref:DUF2345 domain-containing protein n=1 Tax=Rahnella sp. BIGb0603 TaxID=2940612 RepID=UPI00386215C3|nr:uncharacterized protein (DUF2345 family) [Rahnella sp. BIGb0603]